MKLRTIASTSIFSLIPVSVFLTLTPLLLTTPATAQISSPVQSECVRQTMYDAFGNIRPGMTADAAAWACRGATYNNAASECVRQTMYDAFGNIRPGMTADAAAWACRGTTYNNAVSDCVQQTLYDRFGNIRPGMTAEAAALVCEEHRSWPFDVIVIPR